MNRLRMRQLLGAFLVPFGLVVAGFAAVEGLFAFSVLSGLAALFGATIYVGVNRYEEEIYQFYTSPINYTTPAAVAYTLVHVFGLGIVFSGVLYMAVFADLITLVTAWGETTNSIMAFFAGVVPGVVLGAGYPVFVQRQDFVALLNVARTAVDNDGGLSIVAFAALLLHFEPISAVSYAITYVVSRLAIVAIYYGGPRPRAPSS